MQHIVSLSGGTASAVAADRVLTRYGPENTTLWFADTSWEDEDLYRFLEDLEAYWKVTIVRYKDGRTPLEVAEQASIIPNNNIAPCSFKLKVEPFRKFIEQLPKPITVHLGMDFTEQHRMISPKAKYEEIEGITVDFPLMWEPVAMPPQRFEEVANWEQAQRAKGGPRANFSIMKDRARGDSRALPLYELGERKGEQLRLGTSNEDVIGCFCEY